MIKVLVVDDMPVFATYMSNVIPWEDHGFTLVGTAKDGQEALQMARDFKPQIVLTDITMPHMDGMALTEALKTELPEASVIMITGHSEFQYARNALRLGVSDYLVKPFEAQELLIALLRLKPQYNAKASTDNLYLSLESLQTATYLRQLLLSASPGQWLEQQENLGILLPLHQSLYRAEGIRIATIAFLNACKERSSVERIIAQTLADGIPYYLFNDYEDRLVILLCYPSKQDSAFYEDGMDSLKKGLQDKLELPIDYGVSDYFPLHKSLDLIQAPQGSTNRLYLAHIAPLLKHAFHNANDRLHGVLSQSQGAHQEDFSQLKRQRVALEMQAYLDGHFTDPHLNMETVSKALLVNQTDLRAAFKGQLGLTMTEYILQRRMVLAQELIQGGHLKLSEIAERVGYEDQGYFSRCYKRYFGEAPLRHNRQNT